MLRILITILGCNAYLIYVIIFLALSPRRPVDKDGNIIFEGKRD